MVSRYKHFSDEALTLPKAELLIYLNETGALSRRDRLERCDHSTKADVRSDKNVSLSDVYLTLRDQPTNSVHRLYVGTVARNMEKISNHPLNDRLVRLGQDPSALIKGDCRHWMAATKAQELEFLHLKDTTPEFSFSGSGGASRSPASSRRH